ncbi:MAG: type II secretion system major pseudopilin GspG [Alphaproteobacteria bacterium]|nr:type II secretion system major pseudopilin GspG [Alphaproteobacteria bacterium]
MHPKFNDISRCRKRGFTILELLVVIAVIGLLIGMVAPSAMRQLGTAKNKVAAQSVARLVEVLDLYKLDVGTYPTTEQGLKALIAKPEGISGWDGPYLKPAKVPMDPWSKPFQYRSPSQRPDHAFDIFSYGEKGETANENEASLIINE